MAHVLVIDDQALLRATVREFLEDAGHTVAEAEDGHQGYELIRDALPDLVITDIVMPNMEGIELIVGIQNTFPQLPIIAMSGGGRDFEPGDFLGVAEEIGAHRTLFKPFSPDELLRAVEDVLSCQGQAVPQAEA